MVSDPSMMEAIVCLTHWRVRCACRGSDPYAQLCCGIADRTPEFKDGAKTVNFRRLLLTKCYESLIEEPESGSSQGQYGGESTSAAYNSSTTTSSSSGGGGSSASGAAGPSSQQHSWRRQCMLRNVGLIGELFRRQLLTENIMHVCVAMMLDDETTPQPEIIAAACGLLTLVRIVPFRLVSANWMFELTLILSFCRSVGGRPAGRLEPGVSTNDGRVLRRAGPRGPAQDGARAHKGAGYRGA